MTSYPKVADNEMNYFQFKARQMLLLRKEDRKWQEFCKNVAPDCAVCLPENLSSKESREIGIQTYSKPPAAKLGRPILKSRLQNREIPEALNNIRSRLENIDIALTNLYSVNGEKEQISKHQETSILKNADAVKLTADKRRHLIQNSLKTTLDRLHLFPSKTSKNESAIQMKNSSYFLPHDLKVKRVSARKAYLASLQTKPKVRLKSDNQVGKKTTVTPQNKKAGPKITTKPGNKGIAEKKAKIPEDNKEATLISTIENEEENDQNIEHIVDAILDDFFGEAALDFNRIKQRKREKHFVSKQKLLLSKETDSNCLPIMQNSSSSKDTDAKLVVTDKNENIMKLKSFFDHEKPDQSPKLKRAFSTHEETNILPACNAKYVPKGSSIMEKNSDRFQPNTISRTEVSPKFIFDISTAITIDDERAKNIQLNKERYCSYLETISQTAKGNFNPWILNSMLAESILDDCINNITEELRVVPSAFVQDLYNEEFIQQVKQ